MKAGEKRRILIVEDDPHIAEGLKLNLKLQGHEATIAGNGTEGLRMWKTWNPDLIVLDIMLPDISGFDVCAKLKEKTALSATIVVVLSVKDNIEDITRAFHVGADDYIIKPPLPELLTRKIKLYLGIR